MNKKTCARAFLTAGLVIGLVAFGGAWVGPSDAGEVSRKALEEERNPPGRGKNISAGGPSAGKGEVSRKALEEERNPPGSRRTGNSASGARTTGPGEVSRKALEDERNPPGSR